MSNKRDFKNIVVKVKNGFKLKKYFANTNVFSYLSKNNLFFTSRIRDKLIEDGFNIQEWEKGSMLSINGKKAFGSIEKELDDLMNIETPN